MIEGLEPFRIPLIGISMFVILGGLYKLGVSTKEEIKWYLTMGGFIICVTVFMYLFASAVGGG